RTHEVVSAVLLVNMRCLDPDGLFADIHSTIYDDFIRTRHNLIFLQIIIPDLDDPMPLVPFLSLVRCIIVHHVGFAVIVEEKRWVYPIEGEFDGIAPPPMGIL